MAGPYRYPILSASRYSYFTLATRPRAHSYNTRYSQPLLALLARFSAMAWHSSGRTNTEVRYLGYNS